MYDFIITLVRGSGSKSTDQIEEGEERQLRFSDLSQQELQARARRAILKMSPLQRDVFKMLLADDASYDDVAARLNVTVREVELAFVEALTIFVDAVEEARPWWRRVWPG